MTRFLKPLLSVFFILFFTNIFATEEIRIIDKDSLILSQVSKGDIEGLSKILDDNFNINARFGNRKRTLLTYAIENRQFEVTRFLLSKGVNIEQQDGTKTPLMFAARYCNVEFTELLLQNGADINSINNDRNTAFHYAAKYNNFDVLKTLYINGAKVNIPNNDQWTALDYTIINNKPGIRDYLDSIGCRLFEKKLPDYFDGPYISYIDDSVYRIDYLKNKGVKKGLQLYQRKFYRRSIRI